MKPKKMIIPAIIAKNQGEMEEKINLVKNYVEVIQLDVMDGEFVPNESLNFDFKLPSTKCGFEAHLMTKNPWEWVEKHYKKVDTILVHVESVNDHQGIIKLVKSKNKRIGFVLNPGTTVEQIMPYLDQIDQVLIMTVNPGFYGSSFIPETLKKISKLRRVKPQLDLEVDGGINDKTIGLADKAGANMFVSGSYIVQAAMVEKAVDSLKKIITKK